MYAEIIAVGDEIISGQLLDTNSQWLSQRLEELGVRTLFHSTVGDELAPCVEVFRRAIDRADVVVATGGLGPTADDLTRESLAEATGRPVQLDPDALESIRAMFARRGRPMPVQNERQAMFPSGSRVVHNPHGTAPGINLEVPREGRSPCRVFCLPGVPAEMVEMWHGTLAASIREFCGGGRVIRRRLIHCFGAGESQIESMLPDLVRRGRQPTVGITAGKATITLRIMAEGRSETECDAAIEPVAQTIRQCLGDLIFGEGDDQLQHAAVRLLRRRQKTLATAECGSAGLVAEWFSSVEDSADAYRGGLVLSQPGDESADALAARCREQFGADFGLAVGTVLSSPFERGAGGEGPEQESASPIATLALASADGVQQKNIPCGIHPALRQIYLAKHAMNFVRLALQGL